MILIRLFIINTGLTLTLSIVSSPLRWRESDSSYNLVVSHKLPSPMILYVQSRLKMNLDRILVCRHKVQGSVQRLLYLEATEDAPYFT